MTEKVTPALLLQAYATGVFPMAQSRNSPRIFWVDPERRGIFPPGGFHISRSLARALRRQDYAIRINHAFGAVVDACAARPDTWINAAIRRLYGQLHQMGHAHSLEVWAGNDLVGGIYGVTLGGAFFGESMFSRRRDGSKIALAYLTDRLDRAGFSLFDTQFLTDHLASLGAVEISRAEYHVQLRAALGQNGDFTRPRKLPTGQDVVQRNTQTS